jgi:hypothetical protein
MTSNDFLASITCAADNPVSRPIDPIDYETIVTLTAAIVAQLNLVQIPTADPSVVDTQGSVGSLNGLPLSNWFWC